PVVEHRPDPAVGRAADDRVADVERPALHQHGGHRSTALVEMGLDGDALGVHVGIGPQVESSVGGQHDRRQQAVQSVTGDRGDVDEHRLAAVLLRHQAVLGELAPYLARVGALLVDLVDRHHDRHVGSRGVVECLDRLRHHTVVGGHHQHGDVGRLRTTGTHGGECLVTRGVNESDAPVLVVDLGPDLVGTDRLGDATGLTGGDVRLPQRVEQLGLAVVDVTHHRDDRWTGCKVLLVTGVLTELDGEALQQLAVLILGRDHLDVVVQLGTEQLQCLVVHRLGGGHHLAQVEQHLHQRRRIAVALLGQIGQRRTAAQPDLLPVTLTDAHTADRRRLHLVELATPLLARLAPPPRRATGTPECTLGAATSTTTATGRTPAAATAGTAPASTTGTAT